jgi:hypothetical protein
LVVLLEISAATAEGSTTQSGEVHPFSEDGELHEIFEQTHTGLAALPNISHETCGIQIFVGHLLIDIDFRDIVQGNLDSVPHEGIAEEDEGQREQSCTGGHDDAVEDVVGGILLVDDEIDHVADSVDAGEQGGDLGLD